ncbi:hypothetical protein A5gp_00032 [Alteromonas phage vB_AemP_PT15-A5]|nr:hypothetical protein A5gp_00032 [Alteromonas phage vB_AemP_PT15-A5]
MTNTATPAIIGADITIANKEIQANIKPAPRRKILVAGINRQTYHRHLPQGGLTVLLQQLQFQSPLQ